MPPEESNDFSEYRRMIVESLRRIESEMKDQDNDLTEIKSDVKVLKFQAAKSGAVWGSIAGAAATGAITLIIAAIQHSIK